MNRSCACFISTFSSREPVLELTAASVSTLVTLNVIKSWGLLLHRVDGSGLTLHWSEKGRHVRLSVSMQATNAAAHTHIIQ